MPIIWLFSLTIFTSAALLFTLEPMFARMVLPLLGGTPAVWNTCMLFFQTVLLCGYAYAHFVVRRLQTRTQMVCHLAIVLLPLLVLPFGVPEDWVPPADRTPVFWLLGLMAVAVGAPFFVVSATTPLLQKWFATTPHPAADDPYFLYGASNLGSMLALLSYPVLIEPNLGLTAQSNWWAWAYGGFALMMVGCAVTVWRSGRGSRVEIREQNASNQIRPASNQERPDVKALDPGLSTLDPPAWKQRLWWIALAFVPSSWLLGLTTFLTTDIAPVPLLWILPLSLYLLSFILVFARRPLLRHAWMVRLFPWIVALLAFGVIFMVKWPLLLLHVAAFFVGSMVCHGELAAKRPAVSHLTEYFLWLSFGGMLGGLFNALAAPLIFDRPLEYPLTVLLACLLQRSLLPDANVDQQHERPGHRTEFIFLGLFVTTVLVLKANVELQGSDLLVYTVIIAVPLLIVSSLLDLPRLFAASVGTALILNAFDQPSGDEVLVNERSFYGVHRVVADPRGNHWLMHGMTAHGVQSRMAGLRCTPRAYYHSSGPLGDVFELFNEQPIDSRQTKRNVALVGLGSGAAVCYCRPGQEFTFYEIDPTVKQLAETPAYFSYLSECSGGEHRVILGDGRLKLAEAKDKQYSMIVFDAFSSDAIPVHLLTREAFQVYLQKLTANGLLVFHVSNSHLDLEPVIAGLAADAGLTSVIRQDAPYSKEQLNLGLLPPTYIVATRRQADLDPLSRSGRWRPCQTDNLAAPWTDDFSNIIGILKWFR